MNNNKMNCWKWSTGELYYKSARIIHEETSVKTISSQQLAIDQSLDSNIINHFDNESKYSRNQNQREDLDIKIADRELIAQRGVNPFLQQTTYVNDIVTRDMFLKPLNTTQGKFKPSNENKDLEYEE